MYQTDHYWFSNYWIDYLPNLQVEDMCTIVIIVEKSPISRYKEIWNVRACQALSN